MIETIYKSEENKNGKPDINIRLPKNIKQIGQSDADMNCQIYIEENVLAYIKSKPFRENQIRYGVLLGDKKQGNGYTYIFINGMVEVDEVIEDSIIFSDDIWTGIYDNIRRYYKEGMIVGWYASFNYDITKDMLSIRKIHIDHFAGNNKVFLNINREDDDEAFYIYERNGLDKQPCYHVYFEKSPDFEDYIFGSGKKDSGTKEKEAGAKETGKYGIALNNNTGRKESGILEKVTKEGEKLTSGNLGRVASFITIIALAGTLGIMWQNGGLDALGGRMKNFVNGILHSEESETNAGNIISVGGNPTPQQTTASAESTVEANATSSGESTSAEQTTSPEESSSSENVSTEETTKGQDTTTAENKSSEETTTAASAGVTEETETTVNTHATVSDTDSIYATYIVKNGETLYSIAMSFYGTTDMIDDIMELNNITDENYVMEGQKILLP